MLSTAIADKTDAKQIYRNNPNKGTWSNCQQIIIQASIVHPVVKRKGYNEK